MKKDEKNPRLGIRSCDLGIQIKNRLTQLHIDGNPKDYATLDSVWKCVGNRPNNSRYWKYILAIRDGMLPYSENFYWKQNATQELNELSMQLLGMPIKHFYDMVRTRLKKLGLDGSPKDYVIIEDVHKRIGPRPADTDIRTTILMVREGLPPNADNFYWKQIFQTDLINDILAHDAKYRNRIWLMDVMKTMSDDELRYARTHGIRKQRQKNSYEEHIGRTFGTLKVVSVSMRESNGVVYYVYTVKCKRCGHTLTRRASLFIKGDQRVCKVCGYRWSKHVKNSAVVRANRWGRYAPKWKAIENPDPLARIHMAEYLGEFTVYHGTASYMEALIDADLLGIRIG